MSIRKGIKAGETYSAVAEDAGDADLHAPRKMTVAENVILTIKVLVGFGLVGAALWGINFWISPH
jgi:hypothetical protein